MFSGLSFDVSFGSIFIGLTTLSNGGHHLIKGVVVEILDVRSVFSGNFSTQLGRLPPIYVHYIG